jgi:8-oxo-dGTP pyrophosphatase MutT (NUDIX family)
MKSKDEIPGRRMGAGALIFNGQDEILIVKPDYRDYWEIPGGIVEQNESPFSACAREIHEELNLALQPGRLLCLEYRNQEERSSENLHFVFFGGVLSEKQIAEIKLPKAELAEYEFLPSEKAGHKLHPNVHRRVVAALKALKGQGAVYFENGQLPQ